MLTIFILVIFYYHYQQLKSEGKDVQELLTVDKAKTFESVRTFLVLCLRLLHVPEFQRRG